MSIKGSEGAESATPPSKDGPDRGDEILELLKCLDARLADLVGTEDTGVTRRMRS